ncbi:MAG: hypothetical protein AAF368_01725 [Planctomycetota bacterium]
MGKRLFIAALALASTGLLLLGVVFLASRDPRTAEALEFESAAGRSVAKLTEGAETLSAQTLTTEVEALAATGLVEEEPARQSLKRPDASLQIAVRAEGSGVELSGANVRLVHRRARQESEGVEGVTDDQGEVALPVPLSTERVDLIVTAEGYVTANVPSIGFASGRHVQEMIASATIEGYVQLDGAPGARVILWCDSRREVCASKGEESEWGDTPFFRFSGLRPGGYALGLELKGRGIDFVANVQVGPGDTETVNLRAPRPGELELQLVQPGEVERPVADARIKLIPDRQGVPRPMESRTGTRHGRTDERGFWRATGLSPGEWIVDAKAGESKTYRRIEVEAGGRISRVKLPMRPAPALIVRVAGAEGIDPSKLYVFAQGPEDLNPAHRAELRPDGSFFFSGLPSDKRLKIRAGVEIGAWGGGEENRPTRSTFVRLKPQAEPHEIDLQLEGQCTATVVVKRPDGTPWGLGVHLGGVNPSRFGESGTYIFVLPPGPAILEVEGREGVADHRQRVRVKPGENHLFEVTLRAVSEIRGVFSDPTGAALDRLRVRAQRLDVEEGQKRNFDTRTNALGEFVIEDLPEGEFRLSAITRFGQTGAETATAEFVTPRDNGAFFALELPYTDRDPVAVGTILGRAVTRAGERVSRFRVQNLRGGTVSVDGDRFEIRDLRSGRLNLTLVADGCLPQVLRGVELASGGTLDLGTLEFAPSTRVIVDVRGADNKRIGEARVELRTRKVDLAPGQKVSSIRIRDRRRDGRYQREKTPRGRFQLVVRREGYETYRRNVTVRDQRQQFFRMKLKKKASDG